MRPATLLTPIVPALALALSAPATLSAQRADNYLPTASTHVTIDETNLPIVFINVGHKTIQRDSRVTARMKIINNGGGKKNYGDTLAHRGQKADYDGWISLKYRGNSSFNSSDKKPLSVKLIDNTLENGGKKLKSKLLGMGKDNDWTMLAPFADKSMMRDVLTFELGRPYFDYTPHSRYCELILDGTYYGIFIITEKPGKGKHRLDLHDPGEDGGDLTGDYHVEIDRPDESHYFTSKFHPLGRNGSANYNRVITYQYDDPEYDDLETLPGARVAVNKAINDMETSFTLTDYADPGFGYPHYIDPLSFVDYMLTTEFSFNIDGYRLSTHLYKYSDTRAKAEGLDNRWKTTLWDYNIAYGNANYSNGYATTLWQYDFNSREDNAQLVPFWWKKLLADPAFMELARSRWKEYRQGAYSDERLYATVDSLAAELTSGGAMERNEEAWRMFGRKVWPNYYVGTSYADETAYLKQWIKRRVIFLDNMLLPRDADFHTEPMTLTAQSMNSDIIVEALPAGTHVTVPIDSWRSLYSASVRQQGGLPADGQLSSASGIAYRLGAYDADNAVRLSEGEFRKVEFADARNTGALYMLATSTGGDSNLRITLVYADGTPSETQVVNVRDWSVSNPKGDEAVSGLGYISTGDNTLSDRYRYCLFETCVVPDTDKPIAGATISNTSGGHAYVLAFSRVVPMSETGVDNVTTPVLPTITGYYTTDGVKLQQPRRGINIVRYSDGTSRKLLMK